MTLLDVNDGSRPSRLELGRQLTGELPETAPELSDFQAQVETAQGLPAFDWEILSSRAAQIQEDSAEPDSLSSPMDASAEPWWRRWQSWGLALAFAVALIGLPALYQTPEATYTGVKGDVELRFLVDGPEGFASGSEGQVLKPGDRIQFTYRAPLQQSIVLVGVDGTGQSAQYWPETGDVPLSIARDNGLQLLSGSLELDDAPGPEVFVAVFGAGSVGEALELVEDAYAEGGHEAVQALGTLSGVDTLRIEKVR
ncbi:MAG: hypothetical protein VX899_17710 [Myxococcota bacterium]|nr:hypothetical protein [Myxococcota bacterium]